MQVTSLASLFQEAFGIDWRKMEIGKEIDVSAFNIGVKSWDDSIEDFVLSPVLKIIRKPDSPAFELKVDQDRELLGAGNHRVHVRYSITKEPAYISLEDLTHASFFYVHSFLFKNSETGKDVDSWCQAEVVKTKDMIPVLDMMVDRTHNYLSNNVVSHNTVYGNPETVPGGNALKFFAAIRLVTRPGETIDDKEGVQIGMTSRIKSIKNKVAPPHRNCEMKILFDSGYQIEEEFVLAFQKYGIIKKAGGWFSIPAGDGELEKIQGAERVIEWLRAHPVVYEDFKAELKTAMSRKTTSVVVEATDEDEEAVVAEQEALEKDALAEDGISAEDLADLAGENS